MATMSVLAANNMLDSLFMATSFTRLPDTLMVYAGSAPSLPSDTPAGTQLYASTSGGLAGGTTWTAPADGEMQLASTLGYTAANTGTAGFVRLAESTTVTSGVFDLTASVAAGGGDVILASLSLNSAQAFSITNMSISVAKSVGNCFFNVALRNAILNKLKNVGAAGSQLGYNTGATLKLYSGSAPADADAALGGGNTELWTANMSTTTFNAAGGASIGLSASISANGVATGTATFFRLAYNGLVIQGDVTTSGGGGVAIVSTTSIVSGVSASVTDLTFTLG